MSVSTDVSANKKSIDTLDRSQSDPLVDKNFLEQEKQFI